MYNFSYNYASCIYLFLFTFFFVLSNINEKITQERFTDQSVRAVLSGMCLNLRPGHYYNHRHSHEPPADPEGVRLHTKNSNLYLLLGFVGGAVAWRRW